MIFYLYVKQFVIIWNLKHHSRIFYTYFTQENFTLLSVLINQTIILAWRVHKIRLMSTSVSLIYIYFPDIISYTVGGGEGDDGAMVFQ